MNRIILIFCCLLFVLNTYGQTCGNPGARIERLKAAQLSKDSIYNLVKTDLDFIKPIPNDTIADIGSYDGYYPLVYSIFSDSVVFYLNDISSDGFSYFDSIEDICTKIKRHNLSNKFTVVIGNDSSTSLRDHMFNKVVIRDALHHFKSMDIMLSDIKRIMKSNAKLILFEPIRGRNINEETLCKGAMTVDNLIKLLNKNGFVLAREFPQTIGGSWFEFKQTDD